MYLLFYGVDIKERVKFCTGGTSTSGEFGDYFSIVSILMAIGVIEIIVTIGSGLNSLANVIIFLTRSDEVRKLVIKILPKRIIKVFDKKNYIDPLSGKIFIMVQPAKRS
uniref:Uncharacterized protein n=1 Tax=Acrobeloides nanus TaxID=290746 RepID=A0A914EMR6_9BILA